MTRYLVGNADPITLAILRWGIGFFLVLPATFLLRAKFQSRSDWLAVAALGICFFGLFFVFYNIAVGYTTAAPRKPCALHAAGADHDRRRTARHRTSDPAQELRRCDRYARRVRGARLWPFCRT